MGLKNISWQKALLLSKGTIEYAPGFQLKKTGNSSLGNLHKNEWIFLKLNDYSRVRLTIKENAKFTIENSLNDKYKVVDNETQEMLIDQVDIEKILFHAPEQLFFSLYKQCNIKCQFCPLSYRPDNSHFSLARIFEGIKRFGCDEIKSIGITTSCPSSLTEDDIVDEIIFIIKKIQGLIGVSIPIGVSLKTPSYKNLERLKNNGVHELRLNLETYDRNLAKKIMPNKNIEEILNSINDACSIWGRGHVSSNIIIGIGEEDSSVIQGITRLAELGAVATLYPYDPVIAENINFRRPSAERLYHLAHEHKKILDDNQLNPSLLRTMCSACAGSHIYPGRDL